MEQAILDILKAANLSPFSHFSIRCIRSVFVLKCSAPLGFYHNAVGVFLKELFRADRGFFDTSKTRPPNPKVSFHFFKYGLGCAAPRFFI